MFAKSKHLKRGPRPGDVLERLTESLSVSRGHQQPGQPFVAAKGDVVEHVDIDVTVVVDLGFGEHRETHVTQGLHPRPDDVGTAGGDIGEYGGLRLNGDALVAGGQLGGAVEQPTPQRVEPGPVCGRRTAAEDGAEAHVEIGGVPDQQDACGAGRQSRCLDDLFGDAHEGSFSQTSSATALPASRAFPSYLVTGRATETGRPSAAVTRLRRGSASPTSAICSAYPAWSVAACRMPPGRSRSAIRATVSVCSSLRLWWRAFGHGSGKNTRTPVSDSGPNMCSSTSTPSPRMRRMLLTASRSIALSSWASPRRYTSTATTSTSGSALAIASVEVPVPLPISSTTGADRPNHARVSSSSAGPSGDRACAPISGQSRSQVSC